VLFVNSAEEFNTVVFVVLKNARIHPGGMKVRVRKWMRLYVYSYVRKWIRGSGGNQVSKRTGERGGGGHKWMRLYVRKWKRLYVRKCKRIKVRLSECARVPMRAREYGEQSRERVSGRARVTKLVSE
jgi:hypothetical protein